VSRYEFIFAEKAFFPVTVLCRVLEVVRSAYYAWLRRRPTARDQRNERLVVEVRAAHERSGRRYGSPRVRERLARDGISVSRKKVASIMRENSLVGRTKRRFRCSTDSRGTELIAPNLLARDFSASAPNQVWVTDVTELPTRAGSVFLAVIVDLFSRRVVGWALSESNDTALARSALDRALAVRKPPRGLVHHSDRGSPYGSRNYVRALEAAGIRPSMSRTGDCWDNAVAESFFSTLEYECVEGRVFRDYSQVHHEVSAYIDGFYNPERLHSTVGYASPIEYELAFLSQSQAA
jgi:transposase InsO family protein